VDQITNPQMDFDVLLKMPFFRARIYGAAGRLDEAFDCLDQAVAQRDPALVHLAVAPDWDGLRDDPRFDDRLKKWACHASSDRARTASADEAGWRW
jgi:hypothetical protein